MRFQKTGVLILSFALVFACLTPESKSFASDVLLPADNSDQTQAPNLGFSPAPQEVTPPLQPLKTETPQPAASLLPETVTSPAATSAPPFVTQQHTPPAPPNNGSTGMAYNLTISLSHSSSWTANDMQIINTQIGLPPALVRSECMMGINGMIITDQGSNPVDSGLSTSTTVAYQGSVRNVMLSIYASCTSAPRPAPYNYIQRMGSRYNVPLSSAFCDPQVPFAGTKRQLTVTHGANGNDSCLYQ